MPYLLYLLNLFIFPEILVIPCAILTSLKIFLDLMFVLSFLDPFIYVCSQAMIKNVRFYIKEYISHTNATINILSYSTITNSFVFTFTNTTPFTYISLCRLLLLQAFNLVNRYIICQSLKVNNSICVVQFVTLNENNKYNVR